MTASSPLTPLTASSMLSAIGWEKFQSTPGIFSSSRSMAAISLLVLVEHRPPLFLGLQIDEIFGVEKAGGVGAVVGTADLRTTCVTSGNEAG